MPSASLPAWQALSAAKAMLKAIIFDFDGVLLDSESLHFQAIREMLQKRGRDLPIEKFLTYCGTKESFMWPDMFTWAGLPLEETDSLSKERWNLYQKLREGGDPLFPGTLSFLAACRKDGLLLAVSSGTDVSILEKDLRAFGYLPYFSALSCVRECAKGKPAPDVFLLSAKKLGVAPKECLVIEDAKSGMLAAKAAGMSLAGFCGASIPTDMSEAPVSFSDYREMNPSILRAWHEEQQAKRQV